MDSIYTSDALKAVMSGLSNGAPSAAHLVMLFKADGTPEKKFPAQQLVQDMAKAGNG